MMLAALSVLAAAVAGMLMGAIWYGKLFAASWMRAVGMSQEDIEGGSNTPMILAALAALLTAGAMRRIFAVTDVSGVWEGLYNGACFGLFIAAPWVIVHYAFSQRPRPLWWIDAGHTAATIAIMGAVLGALR